MKRKNVLKKIFKFSIYIFLLLFFINLGTNFLNDSYDTYLSRDLTLTDIIESPIESSIVLRSKCDCLRDHRLDIKKDKHFYYSSLALENKYASRISRIVTQSEFETYNFTCNIFDTLRRGKHQKVIALTQVSLESILYFAKQAKSYYPDWIVRVYYSDEIKLSNRCYLQCLKDDKENGELYDNIDFCRFESKYFNVFKYIAIADSFTDYVMHRSKFNLKVTLEESNRINNWVDTSNYSIILAEYEDKLHFSEKMWVLSKKRKSTLLDYLSRLVLDPDKYCSLSDDSSISKNSFYRSMHNEVCKF